MAQSKRRAIQRGSFGKVNSTKVSVYSTGYVFRKGRFNDNPDAEEIARRNRRQRKIDDPKWSLVDGQWVHASKTSV